MRIFSLPDAIAITTKFRRNYKVTLSTHSVNEAVTFPYVSGFYVNEMCKEIGIDQCTSQNGSTYKTNKFKYDGKYCTVGSHDDGTMTIFVDAFARIGTPEADVIIGKWSSIEAAKAGTEDWIE